MHRSSGFTLIELLVVIAIIAILAAILFPIFLTAKQSANRTACLNNLKQMGAAITRYADDNNGYLPDCENIETVPREDARKLCYKLSKYTKSMAIYRCPADGWKVYISGSSKVNYFDYWESSYQNYSKRDTQAPIGGAGPSDLYTYGVRWPVLLSGVPRPSAIRIIRDAAPFHSRTSSGNVERSFCEMFCDGHVKPVRCYDGSPETGLGKDRGGII